MELLRKVVEKVATLDTEVKLRGRKGATFPSQSKQHQIQSEADYYSEVNNRLYSEKEVKIYFLLTGLMDYLHLRLTQFNQL